VSFKQMNLKNFSLIYKKKYGVEPELVSSSSYDATNLILQSGKECGTLLAKIKDYNGVSGSITFDENGDVSDRGMVCLRKDVRMEGDKLADIDIPCE
jgi:ABC-type branched-subunit amino acid transport system substrate-binding protein